MLCYERLINVILTMLGERFNRVKQES